MLAGGSDKELEIVRDLSRTYPSHVYYQQRQGPGQRSLFNVLRAYSIYDRQVSTTCSCMLQTAAVAPVADLHSGDPLSIRALISCRCMLPPVMRVHCPLTMLPSASGLSVCSGVMLASVQVCLGGLCDAGMSFNGR